MFLLLYTYFLVNLLAILLNRFYDNIGGAAIMYSNRITLENNNFNNNRGIISFGLLLQTANDNIIKNNRMTMNMKGLFMDQSNRNLLAYNEISQNNIGIEIWTSSIENSFTQNQFSNNVLQYSSNSKSEQNKWSNEGIGNYWSNHVLYDLDNNGIGDRPYTYATSFGEVLTKNQLGYLFLDSPALKIYESVKHTLSKDQMQITDPHPILPIDHKENVYSLNKGMLQRLGLCVAFLGEPELIILDEPTSGIDPYGRIEIIDMIDSLNQKRKTIIFSSHHLSEIEKVGTHVILIENHTVKKMTAKHYLSAFYKQSGMKMF